MFEKKEAERRVDDALEKGDAAQKLVALKEALDKRDAEIKGELETLAKKVEAKADPAEVRDSVKKLEEVSAKANDLAKAMMELEQKLARPVGGNAQAHVKTLGEFVTENADVRAMMEGKSRSAQVALKTLDSKAGPITSATASAGVLVESDRLGLIRPPDQPLVIRELFMPGRTSSNALEYPRENVFTNSAAPVAELALKPQSDITFTMETTTVKTLAHWMAASKQILDDAPQLASYINGRLIYGLKYVEEQQILLGDGSGQNLLGVIPQATAYTPALETTLDIQQKNKMDVLRAAMLQVQLALYPPSGIVLHPTDWASITLTKDANGNYLIANPQSSVSQLLWTMPVVASMSMPQGDFLVGAFRLGAQIFDREQANVAISYEDRDNFVKNAVTIRAEERLAMAVYRPKAFVKGTFPVPTPPSPPAP